MIARDGVPRAWTLAAGTAPGPRMYTVVEGRLFAGAYPGHSDPQEHGRRLDMLWGAGVRTVISLMEETERTQQGTSFTPYARQLRERAAAAGGRLSCIRLPVRDVTAPTVETVHSALDVIDLSLDAGRPVYVHCYGGIGRTGTIIGCWLRRHGLAARDDVLEVLARLRKSDVERASVVSPETAEQRRVVLDWDESQHDL